MSGCNHELKLWFKGLVCPYCLKKQNERYRKALLTAGLWKEAPCVICGYNGRGYFQPDTHGCAGDALQEQKYG